MKKALIVIVVLFTTVLSGCELVGMSKIAIASNNMDKLDSYLMELEIDVTNIMKMNGTFSVDGDYSEMVMEGEKVSYFEKDGTIYTLGRNWLGLPVLVEDEVDDEEDYDDFTLYKDYDFDQDGDYYVLTDGASDIFEDIDTLKIKIEDDYIVEMILEGVMESYDMVLTITFSEFNNIELNPPFYVTEEEITELEERAEQLGFFEFFHQGSYFSFVGEIVVDCIVDWQVCHIDSDSGSLVYDPNNKTIEVNENGTPEPYEIVISSLDSEIITTEMIEFIDELYFLYMNYGEE